MRMIHHPMLLPVMFGATDFAPKGGENGVTNRDRRLVARNSSGVSEKCAPRDRNWCHTGTGKADGCVSS